MARIATEQQATQEQDAALAVLNEWLAQHVKIAKVALRGKKQLLEKIGVAARTTKTAAQRAAPKKAAATRAAKKAAKEVERKETSEVGATSEVF